MPFFFLPSRTSRYRRYGARQLDAICDLLRTCLGASKAIKMGNKSSSPSMRRTSFTRCQKIKSGLWEPSKLSVQFGKVTAAVLSAFKHLSSAMRQSTKLFGSKLMIEVYCFLHRMILLWIAAVRSSAWSFGQIGLRSLRAGEMLADTPASRSSPNEKECLSRSPMAQA